MISNTSFNTNNKGTLSLSDSIDDSDERTVNVGEDIWEFREYEDEVGSIDDSDQSNLYIGEEIWQLKEPIGEALRYQSRQKPNQDILLRLT